MKVFFNKHITYVYYILIAVLVAVMLFVPVWKIEVFSFGAVMNDGSCYFSIAKQLLYNTNVVKTSQEIIYYYAVSQIAIYRIILSLIIGLVLLRNKKLFWLGLCVFGICLIMIFIFPKINTSLDFNMLDSQGSVQYRGLNFIVLLVVIPIMVLVSIASYVKTRNSVRRRK